MLADIQRMESAARIAMAGSLGAEDSATVADREAFQMIRGAVLAGMVVLIMTAIVLAV